MLLLLSSGAIGDLEKPDVSYSVISDFFHDPLNTTALMGQAVVMQHADIGNNSRLMAPN